MNKILARNNFGITVQTKSEKLGEILVFFVLEDMDAGDGSKVTAHSGIEVEGMGIFKVKREYEFPDEKEATAFIGHIHEEDIPKFKEELFDDIESMYSYFITEIEEGT